MGSNCFLFNRPRMRLLKMKMLQLKRRKRRRTSPKPKKSTKPLGIGNLSIIVNPSGPENLLKSRRMNIVNFTRVSPKTRKNI